MRSEELNSHEDPDLEDEQDTYPENDQVIDEEVNEELDTFEEITDTDLDADSIYESLDKKLDSLNQVLDDMDRKSDALKYRVLNLLNDMRSSNEQLAHSREEETTDMDQ